MYDPSLRQVWQQMLALREVLHAHRILINLMRDGKKYFVYKEHVRLQTLISLHIELLSLLIDEKLTIHRFGSKYCSLACFTSCRIAVEEIQALARTPVDAVRSHSKVGVRSCLLNVFYSTFTCERACCD